MIYQLFAGSLALTLLTEGVLIWLLCRKSRYIYYSVLGNLLTNPALNLALLFTVKLLGPVFYAPSLIFLEAAAVYAEARIYKMLCPCPMRKALRLSFLLNLMSFSIGFFMNLLS